MIVDASVPGSEADLDRLIDEAARASRLLVALDFDGTLAPRVDEPMSARMVPAARAAVDSLVGMPGVEVALVSGRSIVDLDEISEGASAAGMHLAGSHGAEYLLVGEQIEGQPGADETELRDRLRGEAERLTADIAGVWIEPKTLGFGVHTRRCTTADAGRAQALTDGLVEREAPTWRRRTGHDLVEYAFRDTGKDLAIATLRERLHPVLIVFAGDDITDEDGMAVLHAHDLGVRVGPGETHARLRVADPDGLAAVLARIASARRHAG